MYQFDQRRSGRSPFNSTGNPGIVREKEYEVNVHPDINYMIVDDDGNIYVCDPDKKLCCYYSNWTLKWTVQDLGYISLDPPIYQNGFLYLCKSDSLISLFSSNGTIYWTKSDSDYSRCFFNANASIIYCFNGDDTEPHNYLTAFDLSGKKLWTSKYEDDPCVTIFPPAVGLDDTIYLCLNSHLGPINYRLCSIFSNGTMNWSIKKTYSSPVMVDDNNTVYYGQESYSQDGTQEWVLSTQGIRGAHSLGPDGNIIFAADKIYSVYSNGKVKWSKSYALNSRTITADSDGNLFFTGRNLGNPTVYLFMLDSEGNEIWSKVMRYTDQLYSPIILPIGDLLALDILKAGDPLIPHIIGKSIPGPPSMKTPICGDSFVNISWNPPGQDGGERVFEYRVYRKDTPTGIYEYKRMFSPDVKWYLDLNVTNGKEYRYSATAVNIIGESILSSSVSCTPQCNPSPPMNLNGLYGSEFVYITFDAPLDDGGARVTRYDLYRGPDPDSLQFLTTISSAITEYNDTDVSAGKVYYYGLVAINSVGESNLSDLIYGFPWTIPEAPANFRLNSGDSFVSLSWSAPPFNGGYPILNYTLFRGTFGKEEGLELLRTFEPDILEFNDTDVINGDQYIYFMNAATSVGYSKNTLELKGTPAGYPSPPRNLIAKGGDRYINISWDEPENNGGLEITGYIFERKQDSNKLSLSISGNTHEYHDVDIINGLTYQYRILAVTRIGRSSFTGFVEAVALGKPSEPLGLTSHMGRYFSEISWSPPEDDGGSPITYYWIYRNGSYLDNVSGEVLIYNDTVVSKGSSYSYFITAFNKIGESEWSSSINVQIPDEPVVTILTSAPSAPYDINCTVTNLAVVITWSAPESDGNSSIKDYLIYRRSEGEEKLLATVEATNERYEDELVMYGGKYEYWIIARNDVGEGPPSNTVMVSIEDEIEEEKEDEKLPVWLIIIPVILLIIAGLFGIVLLIRRKKDKQNQNDDIDGELTPSMK